ncbi:hypothetical protein ABB37_04276 [Leptomonas pyrrhocoris]|uniref:Uncharacterized protein n=1 Tax=Leptomonas pyrrhocoris TaxID=157538 RepID=A0A0N0DW03_LEPPY|nr:hypothetical protein ABB37_04276 [Leptomonas pyrrhocoris]KPA80854.1 hypothetical protein ABB37_04276 [Leptomonas pyrrhocoris]|eukprot:XP_015659293.1 hypothetical protein ABB37_04276 [Leptomonas pyrrhocoris]
MAAAQQQARKIAWLESLLDTSIIAYESHRNALENIYAQLEQWQQPPGSGCVHISPGEVRELMRDINDVLDQCALHLQPFNNNDDDKDGGKSADGRGAEPDSKVSSHRGAARTPSLPSPTPSRSLTPPPSQQRQQQQRSPPLSAQKDASRTTSATPSEASSVPRALTKAQGQDTPKSADEKVRGNDNDDPSREGSSVRSSARGDSCGRRGGEAPANAVPDKARTKPQPTAKSTGPRGAAAHVPDVSPTQLAKTGSRVAYPGQPTDNTSTRSGTPQSAPPRAASKHDAPQQQEVGADQSQREPSQGPTSHFGSNSNTPAPSQQGAPSASVEKQQPQPRQQQRSPPTRACHHYQRIAQLMQAPWTNPSNNGREGNAALPPTPAAAAPPRARQPAPTSSHTAPTSQPILNESQRSRNPPPPQQQQQRRPRDATSSARTGLASTAPRSVSAGNEDVNNDNDDDAVGVGAIPRRRGSSAAAESESSHSSVVPPHMTEEKEAKSGRSQRSASPHSASQRSHRTPPPQQDQLQQQRSSAIASSSAPSASFATPSQHGSTAAAPVAATTTTPAAAAAVPPAQRQRNAGPTTAAPPPPSQMDASQVGSVGLVHTPSRAPQHDSTRDLSSAAAAVPSPHPAQPQSQQQQQQRSRSSSSLLASSAAEASAAPPPQVPGAHRPLRTAVPRRTTPRAYDSSQSEEAVFHRRRRASLGRPPVRADSPKARRYMDREDSELRQRKEEELSEIHNGPCARIDGAGNVLAITSGSAARAGRGRTNAMAGPGNAGLAQQPSQQQQQVPLTAVEEQLLAERTALHNQLEKMQMEVTIATVRNKEWGNERRYTQLNARMSRVLGDLDRVEKELNTVRNFDQAARSGAAAKAG